MQWKRYRLTGEFWTKLDGVRFLFIVQVIEKAQKKAQFSFCRQRRAFHYEIVLRGTEPYFLHGGALVGLFSAVLKWNQGGDVLENFEVHIYSMVKELITFLKGNLGIYNMFHRRLIYFGIAVYRKITKCAPIGDGVILC